MADIKPARTYMRNDRGGWVPVGDAGSLASEMTVESIYNWYPVKAWSYSVTDSYGRDCDAVFSTERGENCRRRVSMVLDTGRRRLHTIRAEGAEPIGGEFRLEVYELLGPDEQLGGYLRHWPRRDDGGEGDDVLGTIMVRDRMLLELVEGLRAERRVAIGIQMPTYKEAIAHSFDEPWMLHDLYLPYSENVQVDKFTVNVVEEHGDLAEPQTEITAVYPAAIEPDRESVAPAVSPDILKRLNWGLLLLATIAVVLLLK